jgi:hypothetical protein
MVTLFCPAVAVGPLPPAVPVDDPAAPPEDGLLALLPQPAINDAAAVAMRAMIQPARAVVVIFFAPVWLLGMVCRHGVWPLPQVVVVCGLLITG